ALWCIALRYLECRRYKLAPSVQGSPMTSKKTGYRRGALLAAGIPAPAMVAGAGAELPANQNDAPPAAVVRTSAGASVFAPPPGAPMSFADIFEQVSPAVVSINVTSRADARSLRRIP